MSYIISRFKVQPFSILPPVNFYNHISVFFSPLQFLFNVLLCLLGDVSEMYCTVANSGLTQASSF